MVWYSHLLKNFPPFFLIHTIKGIDIVNKIEVYFCSSLAFSMIHQMLAMQTNLSDQHKQIEENNRMGKTKELFKKIRDTKGTFHAKISTIKDINSMDLRETEAIKR